MPRSSSLLSTSIPANGNGRRSPGVGRPRRWEGKLDARPPVPPSARHAGAAARCRAMNQPLLSWVFSPALPITAARGAPPRDSCHLFDFRGHLETTTVDLLGVS